MNIFKILTLSNVNKFSRNLSSGPTGKLENIVNQAEKIIGYPTSFLSLRWILNGELANVAGHLKKLIGTNHPLLKTARDLLLRNELPTWGLIVLLMSKVGGLNPNYTEIEYDRTADILHSQRIVAEVIEMLKTSNLFHKGLINMEALQQDSALHFGNKLALLCGDYLLAASFSEIAKLRNSQVQSLISISVRDLSLLEFIGPKTSQNEPLPSRPLPVQQFIEIPLNFNGEPLNYHEISGHMKSEWIFRTIHSGASLLSNFCKATLVLSNHSEEVQNLGFEFGRNFVLAWQAALERERIMKDKFSLTSAPVMLYLEDVPEFYQEIEQARDNINYDFLRKTILSSHSLEKTSEMKEEFVRNCLKVLKEFDESDSRRVLINIVNTL